MTCSGRRHEPLLPSLQVLRFYGFFKESVVESNIENHRIRKVVLYYYLEDDSMHIAEPRQDNSGIPQVWPSMHFDRSQVYYTPIHRYRAIFLCSRITIGTHKILHIVGPSGTALLKVVIGCCSSPAGFSDPL